MEAAFKEAYASLNAAQKQAVDTIEGPVMVIAGPGTGKTQVLTLRIANILRKTDTSPDSILALTFTDSGARAMRERLLNYLGSAAYQVSLLTFHSFAERLINEYPDAYPKITGGRLAAELERVAILEDILNSTKFKSLRPIGDPHYYIKPIQSVLSDLKRENLGIAGLQSVIAKQESQLENTPRVHEKGAHKGKVRSEYQKAEQALNKNQELLEVFIEYEASLKAKHLYDFDDMIVETVAALETNETMLRDLQETYQYVLADEHQDVNGSQSRILELLSSYHERPNLFVVGDEKQAIFRFQGASLENFLYFEDKFPHTKTISLTENYRSGQAILDVAHDLIQSEHELLAKLRVPLKSKVETEAEITLQKLPNQQLENEWLAKSISDQLAVGVEPAEIAVLFRTNREVENFASLLRKKSIAAKASALGDINSHPLTVATTDLIAAAARPESEADLFKVLSAPYWSLSPTDRGRLLGNRSSDKPLAVIIRSEKELSQLEIVDTDAVLSIAALLDKVHSLALTTSPERLIDILLNESGLKDHASKNDPVESGRVLRRFYDEVSAMAVSGRARNLSEVLRELKLLSDHSLPLNAPFLNPDSNAVNVMTAHKAKGLEFEQVFIPNLVDSAWGGVRSRRLFRIPTTNLEADLIDKLDDEKRLLYVAMTRAKTGLHLSHSETDATGRALTVSRLIAALLPTLPESKDTTDFTDSFEPLSSLGVELSSSLLPEDICLEHLKTKGLSATALNNYLDSPWTWLFRNVLKIPEAKSLPLQYGSAVHSLLEAVIKEHYQAGSGVSVSQLKSELDRVLARLPLSPSEFATLHAKGLAALTVYLEHLKASLPPAVKTEFSLKVMLPTGLETVPMLPLTGHLDRLDFDAEGQLLRVVDYKTGKPKSRNDILGKTKGSNGNYYRQLVFYALLLELYGDERYQTKTGVLSFVEPTSQGRIREEVFEVTDEEVAALKAELIGLVENVVNSKWSAWPVASSDSPYFHLANTLQTGQLH